MSDTQVQCPKCSKDLLKNSTFGLTLYDHKDGLHTEEACIAERERNAYEKGVRDQGERHDAAQEIFALLLEAECVEGGVCAEDDIDSMCWPCRTKHVDKAIREG